MVSVTVPSSPTSVPAISERDRVFRVVVAVVAIALLARLVALGGRVAHFDEARVAWWALDQARTGQFQYRYIIHGPFLRHVNALVFPLLGPSDFAMRLVPALVGGLLPLSALLLRSRLRDPEVVALALLLAFDPVLLYYSRFSRSTILVATFMFVAFCLFVRALDARNPWYAHAGVAFAALGFTAKENAVVYVVVWLGAAALLVDHRLFSPFAGESGVDRLRARQPIGWLRARVRPLLGHVALGAVILTSVIVFFYAPRGVEVGLYRALTDPGRFPAMLDATVGLHPERFADVGWRGGYKGGIVGGLEYWFGGPGRTGGDGNLAKTYVDTLARFLEVVAVYGTAVLVLGVAGFLAERYGSARPRDLVAFCGYWGFASVLGYPLGTDIWGAWITVNALVPLAVPAAVGLGLLYRWGRDALAAGDRLGTGLTAAVLLLLVGQAAFAGASAAFIQPTADDNLLVQYAQPDQELRPVLADLSAAADRGEDPHLLVYDEPNASRTLVDGEERSLWTPACLNWWYALPIPWYAEQDGVTVSCARSTTALARAADAEPPFVLARVDDRATVRERLPEYRVHATYYHRTRGFEKVVFVHEDYGRKQGLW